MTEAEAVQVLKSAALRWAKHLEACDKRSAESGQRKGYVLEIAEIDAAVDMVNS